MTPKRYFRNKRVLVTGASGLIGKNLVDYLSSFNCALRIHLHKSLPKGGFSKKLKVTKGDLCDKKVCLRATKNIDIVIHCAAKSEDAKTIPENPKKLVTENAVMNSYLLDAAHENGVKRFVFISSTTVDHRDFYRGVADVKQFTEDLCRFYHMKYGMSTLVIRPTNVYGPYDKFDERSHVIPALIKRAVDRENPFTIWGNGRDQRDFMYIEDFIEKLVEVISSDSGIFHILTIGSGKSHTIRTVADMILHILSHRPKVICNMKKPRMIQFNLPEVGIEANDTNIYGGLRKTIQWYLKNYTTQHILIP